MTLTDVYGIDMTKACLLGVFREAVRRAEREREAGERQADLHGDAHIVEFLTELCHYPDDATLVPTHMWATHTECILNTILPTLAPPYQETQIQKIIKRAFRAWARQTEHIPRVVFWGDVYYVDYNE